MMLSKVWERKYWSRSAMFEIGNHTHKAYTYGSTHAISHEFYLANILLMHVPRLLFIILSYNNP